jgi:tetratricopeptide (TPR) repeat protein
MFFERALVLSEAQAYAWGIGFSLINLCGLKCYSGDWDVAGSMARRALELARSMNPAWWSVYAWLAAGQFSFLTGDWNLATNHLEHVIDEARRSGDVQALRDANHWLARLDLAQEEPERALDRLTPLHDSQAQEEIDIADMVPILAGAYVESGQFEIASSLLHNGIEKARKHERRVVLAELLTVLGVLAVRQEHWEEGSKAFEEALALVRPMPYPYQEALVLYESGRMDLQRGNAEKVRAGLQEALDIFKRLGAQKDAERTAQALAGLKG